MSEQLRVLFIEDNPADVDLIREMLSEASPVSFRIEAVPRLSKALTLLKGGNIDLVLLDLGLPDSQGIETFRKLQKATTHIPTIVLTGHDDQETAVAAMREGAQDYLVKGQIGEDLLIRAARYAVERKRAEGVLRKERDKAQQYLDIVEVMLVALDKKGNITLINRKGNQILEYEEGDLLGKNWFTTCLPSPFRKNVKDVFQKLMVGEERITEFYENPVLTKSGTERIIAWHNAILKNAQGNPIGTLSSGEDITERKRAEDALRESEARFRTLFEAISDTVIVHDDEGAILHINEMGAQRLEWSAKDLAGRNLREIVTPECAASIPDHVREARKAGWSRFETTYVSRSGWRTTAEVYEHPIKFGKEKAILSVARDITERKEAERALLAEKNFSNAVINSSPGLLFVFGEKGNIIQWNSKVEIVTGYSAIEIAKMNILNFVLKDDQKTATEAIQEALTKGRASLEIDVLSKSGKKHPFLYHRTTHNN